MKKYRVEIEALHIIDIDASSKQEALNKIRKANLNAQTTQPIEYRFGVDDVCNGNYHYEDCDFKKAHVEQL
tara:strand:+ start:794 stop:1006 length:213 start_codon:yes stop_codon:yes gene_type:complete